jgi:putative endonuclease
VALSRSYAVYILASARNGTLYIGVSSDLIGRVWQHKNEQADGFTKKYGVKTLVWFEVHEDVNAAITREKQIKEWKRDWKIELIENENPYWNDLYSTLPP